MVDESKSLEEVATDIDDNEVAAATMNQRNLPWDQNSRPNSSLHQLLPRELLDDDIHHRQMQLLPTHHLDYAMSNFDDLLAPSVASEIEQTPPSFQPPERRGLDDDEKSSERLSQHREKRQRLIDPSLSPPPAPNCHDDNEFLRNYPSDDENVKEASIRQQQQHDPLSDSYFPPPPPPGYPSYYSYSSIPRYTDTHHPGEYYGYQHPYTFGDLPPPGGAGLFHPHDYGPEVAAAPVDWLGNYADPNVRSTAASYEGSSSHGSDIPQHPLNQPPTQHHQAAHDAQARPFHNAQLAAHTGERTSQIPAGPTEAERREAGNNRAEQALEKWYSMLQELYEYKAKHGDCRVPQKYAEQPTLGVWVNKQRMEFKPFLEEPTRERTVITSEKLRHLKDVGFEWAKPKGDQLWNEKYEELRQYRQYEGHCNVPTKYTRNPTLGRWVSTQRAQYKDFQDGKKTPMTQERIDKLNELKFVWSMMK